MGQQLEQLLLARGATRLASGQGIGACRRCAPHLFHGNGGSAVAKRSGHGGRDHFTNGVVVVVRGPPEQLDGRAVEHWLRIQHIEHRLEPFRRQV
jgi:hypothetical protein